MNSDIKTAIVFDTAAENSGALSVLKGFYQAARADKSVNWIFVVSKPKLEESDNVKVLNFPETKKSWLHRLYFDWFVAPKLAKIYKANCVFSLQNVAVRSGSLPQIVFLHQPIPFCPKKFSLFKSPKLWIYQNVVSHLILNSAKKADKVVVQTKWMKDALVSRTGCPTEKIEQIPPHIPSAPDKEFENSPNNYKNFFYPATPVPYKNHSAILQAAKILMSEGLGDFAINLTLGPESPIARKFASEGVNINPLGMVSEKKMCELYSKNVVLFASYLESFGYPLLEARMFKAPILASDMPFSREILGGYENARFFNPDNPQELASLMKECILGKFRYTRPKGKFSMDNAGWENVIKLIKEL